MRHLLAVVVLFNLADSLTAQTPLANVPAKRRVPRRTADTVVVETKGDTLMLSSFRKSRFEGSSDSSSTDPTGIWVGATVAYNFARSGSAAEKLNVAGQIVLNNWSPGWKPFRNSIFRVPIVGNIAKPTTGEETAEQLKNQAQEIISSSEGIYAGILPYLQLQLGDKGYAMRAFASASIRTNGLKDRTTDSTFFMTHGRFTVGALFTLGQFDEGSGAFSVETAYARFKEGDYMRAFGERKRSIMSTDIVFILPVASSVGLLGQYVFNHSGGEDVWRAGMVLKPASGQ